MSKHEEKKSDRSESVPVALHNPLVAGVRCVAGVLSKLIEKLAQQIIAVFIPMLLELIIPLLML
jgi:hypothetical protein